MVWCGEERFERVRWYGRDVLKTKDWSIEWDERDVRRDGSCDKGQEREDEEHSKVLGSNVVLVCESCVLRSIYTVI